MAAQLPNELIGEILSRLPSKSLLRFRSVCKSWLSLISSTEFRLMHFHNFNKSNPRHLVRCFDFREHKEVYTVHLDDQHFTLDSSAPIEFPFNIMSQDVYCYMIIGCCNGVVCLCNDNTLEDEVILWNPSVRRYLTLVPPIFPDSYWYELIPVLGFGYDTVSDDYKVVRLAYDGLFFTARPHVEIYTVKTAVWRAVVFPDDLRCFFIRPEQSQVFFSESLHWIASDPIPEVSHSSIMTFDMITEIFGEIQLPEDLVLVAMTDVVVAVVGEFLGVIYSSRCDSSWHPSSTYVIWALKEYKNPATWTKMHTIHYPNEDVGRILQVRNNGDLIIESNYGDLTIYNREVCHYVYTSSIRIMVANSIFIDKYQESLALLDVEHDVLDEERVEEGDDEEFDNEWLARDFLSVLGGLLLRKLSNLRRQKLSFVGIDIKLLKALVDEIMMTTKLQKLKMAGHLPMEVIVEILSRLPSKSLLRCRSICKSWLSLISSTEFKLMHLNNFNQQNPRNLVRCFKWRENKEVYSVHFDDEALTADHSTLIEFPFHRNRQMIFYFRIIGCCNGVVCLSDDKCESREDKIILWNPSVRRNVTLIPPMFRSSDMEDLLLVFGFGYDKMSDDYKVVRLAYDDCSMTRPQVEVYTVKTAIWRVVVFPHDLLCFSILPNWSQVFFKGSIHWISCDLSTPGISRCSIMTFDISTELFAQIQLPESLLQESAMSLEIAVVRESLAVIYSSRHSHSFPWSGPSTYRIWAMKEYKNPASWIMIYNMHYPTEDVGRVLRLRNNGDLITGSRYGDLIIHTDNVGYYVYASRTGFIIEDSVYIDIYQQSLALLDAEPDVQSEEMRGKGRVEGYDDVSLARYGARNLFPWPENEN